jgi:hypothetical protein
MTSGVRVDHLDAALEDRHLKYLKLWEAVRKQIGEESMPPEDEPQPSGAARPTPKNGGARRLTVARYRNTLRSLLLLDDDLTDILPPDAVSRDGFVNNQETLALSPFMLNREDGSGASTTHNSRNLPTLVAGGGKRTTTPPSVVVKGAVSSVPGKP